MYRYVAIIGESGAEDLKKSLFSKLQRLRSINDTWRVIYQSDSLIVVDNSGEEGATRRHYLSNGQGIIIGHLFYPKPNGSKNCVSRSVGTIIPDDDSENILKTNGTWLIEEFWGSYTAIFKERHGEVTVVRSPFGQPSCYYCQVDGENIIFSDPACLEMIDKRNINIDWENAIYYLKYPYTLNNTTAIEGVCKLQPGQSVTLYRGKKEIKTVWDPTKFYDNMINDDINHIKSVMKNIFFSCFGAWSSTFHKSLLQLSGGLDSSLVAGGMAALPNKPDIICLTAYHHSLSSDDERDYARITAKRANYPLLEEKILSTDINTEIYNNLYMRPDPVLINPGNQFWARVIEIANQHEVDSIMTGDGGDGLFGALKNNAAALDYAYDNGITADILKVTMRSARLADISIWHSLWQVTYLLMTRNVGKFQIGKGQVMSWGISSHVAKYLGELDFPLPWSKTAQSIPPGKFGQISDITGVSEYYSFSPDLPFIEIIQPLLSQPLAEFCLRIPYHLHQVDGRERGLARQVFSDILADEVRLRRFKSGGGAVPNDALGQKREFFIKFLLDGVLADRGFIDKDAISSAGLVGSISPEQVVRIMQLTSVEAWARNITRNMSE